MRRDHFINDRWRKTTTPRIRRVIFRAICHEAEDAARNHLAADLHRIGGVVFPSFDIATGEEEWNIKWRQ